MAEDGRLDPRSRRSIQAAVMHMLSEEQRRQSSLFLNDRVLASDTVLGPHYEGIRVKSTRAVLVFVDYHPQANFGHECRYLLFDPDSARLLEDYEARFPPFPQGWPRHYQRFDDRRPRLPGRIWRSARRALRKLTRFVFAVPVPGSSGGSIPATPATPITPAPPATPATGRRFAILFAGTPDPCHLNTLEFGYRTLRSLGFECEDIIVCCYEGGPVPNCPKWKTAGGSPWPGDNTGFKMRVDHYGTRYGFQQAVNKLVQKQPGPNDLLFIYTSGHGSSVTEAGPGSCFLDTPDEQYFTTLFKQDLALLQIGQMGVPRFGRLVVLMGQCCAGGFAQFVLGSGIASSIAFASASQWDTLSYNDGDNDGEFTWSCFVKDWIAAQSGKDYGGLALVPNADAIPADNRIGAKEAYDYSAAPPRKHPGDKPLEAYSATAAEQLALDGS